MKHNTSDYQRFSSEIVRWYQQNPRDLPWRETQDPYKIWLSEIILQQTRVVQGMPYYYAFINTYPTVKDLALAPEEEVLRLWQGLGYYSRARNLHFCAKTIWFDLEGNFPSTYTELLKLKGVGTYTASAIASFAFGECKAVVDGNVFRVLARYYGIETDIASGKGKKEFETLANTIIPKDNPAEFNQAMMDFGARLCTPKNPSCDLCPISSSCFAFNHNMVSDLPVKINKTKVRERYFHYYIIRCGTKWVWKKRGPGDIWEGLYDFPLAETEALDGMNNFTMPLGVAGEIIKFPKTYRHILSHQKLNAVFSTVEIDEKNLRNLEEWCEQKSFTLIDKDKIEYLAKPKLIVNFLNDHSI